MEIQASRTRARVGPSGEPILLLDQNRARWDQLLIRRGLAALDARRGARRRARALRAPGRDRRLPRPRARPPDETDWARIAALYATLAQLTPSPIVELNRAVAVAMAFGPAAGLELVDALTAEPALQRYHLLPSVRGDFSVQARPLRRGAGGIRARGRADPEYPRARLASRSRGIVPATVHWCWMTLPHPRSARLALPVARS